MRSGPFAYHVIVTAYGFWLPNDPRGSWSEFVRSFELYRAGGPATKTEETRSLARRPHDAAARRGAKRALKRPPVRFDGLQAKAVALGFGKQIHADDLCCWACAVMPDHAHFVFAARGPLADVPRTGPGSLRQTATRLKAAATKRLNEEHRHPFGDRADADGKVPKAWARGEWCVFLQDETDVRRAIRYVEQNPVKDGHRVQHWSFITPFDAPLAATGGSVHGPRGTLPSVAAKNTRERSSPLWHPFTPMRAFAAEDAPQIAAADGFELIDSRGNRYLDGVSSLWCNVHGHRVPEIDAAVRAQLDKVAHSTLLGLRCDVADELARELVRIAPANDAAEPLSKVFFSDSGATCVEVALKMAFQYHRQKANPERRDLFLKVSHAYHGDTVGTASVGGISLFHTLYGELFYKTAAVPSPTPPGYPYALPNGHDADSLPRWALAETDRLLGEHAGRVAALVMEPRVQGAGGILVHPDGYLRSIRDLCTQHDVPLIADEVAVGFGKTGATWACETEQVVPDFLCTAKGLTGGYLPVAATLTTDRIHDAFLGEPHELRTFFHGHTFTGNALGCAAALASLAKFERDDCPARARALSEAMGERLAPLGEHPHVAAVRRCGVMVGIDLVADRDPHRPFPAERRTGHRAVIEARKRGVILRPLGDTLVLMPAVGMPVALADRLCETAIAAIGAAARD